jgi:AraC-like DNA-binding protein
MDMSQVSQPYTSPRTANFNRRIERVLSIMREHPEQHHTTHSLAAIAALSPYHFNRIFRREMGIPPAQYLCAVRIETARRLLLTTPLSVTDVCFDVGYNSLGTFVTRFSQLVGLSPRALRRVAANFQSAHLRHICEREHERSLKLCYPDAIKGRINAPPGFEGATFVGLFCTPMPDASPVRCQVLAEPGPFYLAPAPTGTYYIAAATAPWSDNVSDLFTQGSLRASYGPITAADGEIGGSLELVLRTPERQDQPILPAFPLLSHLALHGASAAVRSASEGPRKII